MSTLLRILARGGLRPCGGLLQAGLLAAVLAAGAAGAAAQSPPPPPPVNDNFASRITLSSGNVVVHGTTAGATQEAAEIPVLSPVYGASVNYRYTVWYQWQAPADKVYTAKLSHSASQALSSAAVFEGDSLANLKLTAYLYGGGSNFSFSFQTRPGAVYQICVAGYNNFYWGEFDLSISLGNTLVTSPGVVNLAPAANDNFANAAALPGTAVSGIASNLTATREPGEPSNPTYYAGSLWWTWTAPADATVTVDNAGSNAGRQSVDVFTGTSLAQLAFVGYSTDTNLPKVVFQAFRGQQYYITQGTYAYDFDSVNPAGTSVLNLSTTPSLANSPVGTPAAGNDFFAQRTDLGNAATVSAVGYNYSATRESFEPFDATTFDRTLWWQWTAPADGTCTVDTTNSNESTSLAVFTGSSLNSLQPVTDPVIRQQPAVLSFPATAGTTYQIQVGTSQYDSVVGGIVLNLSLKPNRPSVTLVKPVVSQNKKGISRATVNGTSFAFKGTATGGQGGVKKVTVNLAGYAVAKAKLAADGSWKAPFAGVPPGVYQAAVAAVDNAGNKSDKVSLRLIVR